MNCAYLYARGAQFREHNTLSSFAKSKELGLALFDKQLQSKQFMEITSTKCQDCLEGTSDQTPIL